MKKVLVVDDNNDERRILRTTLERHGFEVTEARDGKEGLEAAVLRKPDLIISNALMPRMDGYSFLREVKKDENLKSVPFIFYSLVYTGYKEAELAVFLGAEAFIAGPKEPEEFWKELSRVLEEHGRRGAERKPERKLPGKDEEFFKKYSFILMTKLTETVAELQKALAEFKHSQEALRESEQRFAAFMLHMPAAAWIKDLQGRYVYGNAEAERIFSTPLRALLGKTDFDIFSEKTARQFVENDRRVLAEGGSLETTEVLRQADGIDHYSIVSKFAVPGPDGRPAHIAGVAFDITDRNEAVRKLRESEERYRSLVDTSTEWIWEMDMQGRIIFNNPAVERILGYPPAELIGEKAFDLIYEEDRGEAARIVQEAIEGKRGWKKCLLRWKHRGGSLRFIESNSAPFLDEERNLSGFHGFGHDLTELKNSEQALKKAYAELEIKVRERTIDLAKKNQELQAEIAERRRAVELIRKSRDLGDALNHINTTIHSTLDFNGIMQRVVKEAADAMHVDATMIGEFENGNFHVRYTYNMPEEFSRRTLTSHELRAMSYAEKAKDAVIFNDAFNDERLNIQFVREMGIRSLLISPVILKKRITGALVFYGLKRRIEFSEEHMDFARKLAASVSLALENATLYRELRGSRAVSESRFAELRTIYETAPVGLCFIDRSMRYVSINRKLAEINGVPAEETVGRSLREIIANEDAAGTIEALCKRAVATGMPIENVEIARKKDLIVLANYYPVRDHTGAFVGVNVVVQDITERKRTEEALRTSERLLKALLNSIPDIAWLKDRESRFILVNEPFGKASGKAPDELIGKTDLNAWPRDLAERYRADDFEVMKSRLPKRVEEPLVPTEGAVRWIETIKTPIYNEEGAVIGTAGIARDTTERKRMEEEIRHMALHDPLTGLPNRRMFLDILNLEIAQARRHKNKLAVLFLDLDRFKEINDTLGHDLGDRLLRHVGGRFRSVIRESDTVARIGGDEFNMVLSDITRPDDVSDIALKIVNSLARPILLKGHELHISTSIGISVYPDDSDDVQTLLRYADIAMYHAKERGRNTFRFYNPSINVTSLERMKLESCLRQTIKRQELSLLYQPQIDIKSKKIRYAEALVRWRHPDRGVLDPKDFIPLAEETGFIAAIDEWVLRAVCSQAKSWKDNGLDFRITVNLSARLFQSPGLVTMIAAALRETGTPPDCLDLEVTESTAMSNVEKSAAQLRELRDMGVHISIDDFGTGYSSLNYLKKLPIERLKIDKSFVQDIARDADDRAIISAVTSMARKMGIRTVAEGVETEEQLEFLRESECDEAQGFLFSRPVPPGEFSEMIRKAA